MHSRDGATASQGHPEPYILTSAKRGGVGTIYTIRTQGDEIELLRDNRVVLGGIAPRVNLLNEDSPRLSLWSTEVAGESEETESDAASRVYTCKYKDSEDKVVVELRIRCQQDLVLWWVSAERLHSWTENGFFAPVGGVSIHVRQVPGLRGYCATYLYHMWWTRPQFGRDLREVPQKTQSLMWQSESLFHHLLPVSDGDVKADLQGDPEGGVSIVVSNYFSGCNDMAGLVAVYGGANDPFQLTQRTVSHAACNLQKPIPTRHQRWYPAQLEYLGWCSWDAFYQKVNEEGLLAKAAELRELGLPVKWMIIDDGWSESENSKLVGFDADKAKFPNGLRHTISQLKASHGLTWVGVWHAFFGYWEGVHPDSDLALRYRDNLYATGTGYLVPNPDVEKGFPFWNGWHSYLRQQGVDFVKVDSQSTLANFMMNQQPIGRAARGAHTALEASTALHFGNALINCMGMAVEEVWNRPSSGVARNSDDFFPTQRKDSFPEHVLQNAYNAVYHAEVMWPDWDMWWTQHEDAVNHAVLRAVSGGPVYISDGLGKTTPDLVWPLIYRDGQILRTDLPARPTADCLVASPVLNQTPLKLWTRIGEYGIAASFHVSSEQRVTGSLSPREIPGLNQDGYAVYEHFSKYLVVVGRDEEVPFELSFRDRRLYILSPVKNGFAVLGLLDKYASPHAILDTLFDAWSVTIRLREGGQLGVAAAQLPRRVTIQGKEVPFGYSEGLCIVNCDQYPHAISVVIER